MKIKLFLTTLGLIILSSSTIQQKNEIKKAEWLIGTWINKTSKGDIYENWIKVSDQEFAGKSYIIKENKPVVFETIQLTQEHGGIFYTPIVKNQNNGLPVRFSLTTMSDSVMVFENPQHDFPQIIEYRNIESDSLVVEISGINNGLERKQIFPMKRVQL